MVTWILNCNLTVYKIQICESVGFSVRKLTFRRVKDHVSGDET